MLECGSHSLKTGRQRISPAEVTAVMTHHGEREHNIYTILRERVGLEYAMFNTSSFCITVGKLFQDVLCVLFCFLFFVEGDMGKENCIVGL